jgi:hypothetical protein
MRELIQGLVEGLIKGLIQNVDYRSSNIRQAVPDKNKSSHERLAGASGAAQQAEALCL